MEEGDGRTGGHEGRGDICYTFNTGASLSVRDLGTNWGRLHLTNLQNYKWTKTHPTKASLEIALIDKLLWLLNAPC